MNDGSDEAAKPPLSAAAVLPADDEDGLAARDKKSRKTSPSPPPESDVTDASHCEAPAAKHTDANSTATPAKDGGILGGNDDDDNDVVLLSDDDFVASALNLCPNDEDVPSGYVAYKIYAHSQRNSELAHAVRERRQRTPNQRKHDTLASPLAVRVYTRLVLAPYSDIVQKTGSSLGVFDFSRVQSLLEKVLASNVSHASARRQLLRALAAEVRVRYLFLSTRGGEPTALVAPLVVRVRGAARFTDADRTLCVFVASILRCEFAEFVCVRYANEQDEFFDYSRPFHLHAPRGDSTARFKSVCMGRVHVSSNACAAMLACIHAAYEARDTVIHRLPADADVVQRVYSASAFAELTRIAYGASHDTASRTDLAVLETLRNDTSFEAVWRVLPSVFRNGVVTFRSRVLQHVAADLG